MELGGKNTSVWIATTPETHYPALQTEIKTDIAILGAGFSGLAAAYYLAKSWKKVIVIDAFRIVSGTSGYTTAKVTSLHGLIYDFLLGNFGEKKAKIYANSNEWAISELARIVKTEKIACDFAREDAFTFSNHKENFEKIEKEVKAAQQLGLPATLTQTFKNPPFAIKTAVKFSNQALFNPRKFLLALAKKLVKQGVKIYEQTPAKDIEEKDNYCIVSTEKGKIQAQNIVIATNYPIYEKATMALRMNQVRSYAFAIQVPKKSFKGMYLGVGDDEVSIRHYKDDGKEWLIVGGEDHPVGDGSSGTDHYMQLQKYIQKLFPHAKTDYRWAAQDSSPIDRVPYIGQLPTSKHVFIITGFDEWGMTKSLVAGKLLGDILSRRKNEWEDFYSPARINIKASLKKSLTIGKGALKGFGRHVPRPDGTLARIPKGDGKVIDRKGKKIAVFRDTAGKLHTLSAVCTHLGCIVDFNKGEQSWDCPCHGSRFTTAGKVINGPAVKNLPKERLE